MPEAALYPWAVAWSSTPSRHVSIERALEAPGDVRAQLRGAELARALDEAAANVEAPLERMRRVLHGAR